MFDGFDAFNMYCTIGVSISSLHRATDSLIYILNTMVFNLKVVFSSYCGLTLNGCVFEHRTFYIAQISALRLEGKRHALHSVLVATQWTDQAAVIHYYSVTILLPGVSINWKSKLVYTFTCISTQYKYPSN